MSKSIIPTYIINLEKRKDRRSYIEQEFANKAEFNLTIVKAIEDKIPAVGLYKTLKTILLQAKGNSLPYILICEDDHQFTNYYRKSDFIDAIDDLNRECVDVYLGGVSWFDYAIPVKDEYYWVNSFNGTQFMVIYSRIYDTLLNAEFPETTTIDVWIAQLSNKVYVSVPMLSIQKDFGYSDVTEQNNEFGKVEKYFTDIISRWEALGKIYDHLDHTKLVEILPADKCSELQVPTYFINLGSNRESIDKIEEQFEGRNEFDTQMVDGFGATNDAVGRWKSLVKVIQLAKEREDEVSLVCWNDHVFHENYNKNILFSSIYQGAHLGADIILGGISHTRQAIPVNEYLCWIDIFEGKQFTIIYNHFFDAILKEDFKDQDDVDLKLSEMTANKYVIHPFISIQKEPSISSQKEPDHNHITIGNLEKSNFANKFDICEKKIDAIRQKTAIRNNIVSY